MLYAEDLTEGQTFKLGTYTIGEAEILAFAGNMIRCRSIPIRPLLPWGRSEG